MSHRERVRELEAAVREFLGLLYPYYWNEDDAELHAVNRLRKMLGMREQMPKCCEAEAQADEAEGKPLPDHEVYHRETHSHLES